MVEKSRVEKSGVEMSSQNMPLLPFLPVHQNSQQALRAYCPTIYTVGVGGFGLLQSEIPTMIKLSWKET